MLQDEIMIKLIGKITLEYPNIDQLKLRDIIGSVLIDYNITSKEKGLITSDLPEKIQLFLAVKKLDNLSLKTIYNYRLQLNNFADFIHKPINSISTMDIRYYLAYKSQKIKPNSMVTLIDELKTFFGWCKSEEIILKDPTKNIKNTKVPKILKNPLSIEELEILRQACENKRDHAMLEVLYATGVRVSELSLMNKEDIKWETKTIKVFGKGSKERIVCFTDRTKLYLRQYLESRDDDKEALFVTLKNPIDRLGIRGIETAIKKIAKISGIKKNVFPHLIRATNASISLVNGASIYSIQKLLGHESVNTTERYAIASEGYIRNEYDKHFVI